MATADAAEECAICFEAPQPGAEVCTLRCGHGYCHACIKEWWAQPGLKTCPTCRKCFAGLRGCVVTTVPAAPAVASEPRPRTAASAAPRCRRSRRRPPRLAQRRRRWPRNDGAMM